jgi:cytosine/uracil/thiamine/allantoin permease
MRGYLIRHGEYDVQAFFDPSGGPYAMNGTDPSWLVGLVVTVPL